MITKQCRGKDSIHHCNLKRLRWGEFTLKFLGIKISKNVILIQNITDLTGKPSSMLEKFGMLCEILRIFYRCATECTFSNSITVWFDNSTTWNRKSSQQLVAKAAHKIIGTALPALKDINESSLVDPRYH